MSRFVYVTKKEYMPIKNELIRIMNLVQKEVADKFTFRYDFTGSAKRTMVTIDLGSNQGFDFEISVEVNDRDDLYSPDDIYSVMILAINKIARGFWYSACEINKKCILITVKDRKNIKRIHTVEITFIRNYTDEEGNLRQQYIAYNKEKDQCSWEEQNESVISVQEKYEWLKGAGLEKYIKEKYLERKNANTDPNKKSKSIFAETVAAIYNEYYNQQGEEL